MRILLLVLLAGCSYYDDGYESEDPPQNNGREVSAEFVSAVQAECLQCHGSSGRSPRLDSKDSIQRANARICAVVQRGTMPPAGFKDSENKSAIRGWCNP